MKKNVFIFTPLFTALLLSSSLTGCNTMRRHSALENPAKRFLSIKELAGVWESKGKTPAERERVVYKVTSGGTAVQETLFPGSTHEMISVYHLEGRDLAMTHYCLLDNQPHLKASALDEKTLLFDLAASPGFNPRTDDHMHQLKFTFVSPNHIVQEWTGYKNGEPHHTKVIELYRLAD